MVFRCVSKGFSWLFRGFLLVLAPFFFNPAPPNGIFDPQQLSLTRDQGSIASVIRAGNSAFEKPTSRSASRNSSQVTVPLHKLWLCPESDTESLKMHCTTKQEKWRKLQPIISAVGTEKKSGSLIQHLSTSFESFHQVIH